MKFTPERRDTVITLVAGGAPLARAAAEAGISERTVHTWLARGRAGATPAAKDFADALDRAVGVAGGERLSEDDVIRLVERAAQRGSVGAMKILLERFEKERDAVEIAAEAPEADPYDRIAEDRQRLRAV